MVYRLINHAGCWKNTRRICKSRVIYEFFEIFSNIPRGLSAYKMLFLTNELAKKAEITILSARKATRPGLQAGASWVERKPYIRGSVARDGHLACLGWFLPGPPQINLFAC